MTLRRLQEVPFYPVPFPELSREEIVAEIASVEETGEVQSFIAVNAHTVYLAERDPEFAEILRSGHRFCDGFGVHLLAMCQGLRKPRHRNTPTDFMWEVFARLAREGKTVFLLGDEPGVAADFARLLESSHPGLVAGYEHGFFESTEAVEAAINASGAYLLCVGMGQPRQEKWVYERRRRLRCPAAFHIGASMAFAIGARRRGPTWATNCGLEWLFRVLHEPRRMFGRYFVEIPWLIGRSLRHAFVRR